MATTTTIPRTPPPAHGLARLLLCLLLSAGLAGGCSAEDTTSPDDATAADSDQGSDSGATGDGVDAAESADAADVGSAEDAAEPGDAAAATDVAPTDDAATNDAATNDVATDTDAGKAEDTQGDVDSAESPDVPDAPDVPDVPDSADLNDAADTDDAADLDDSTNLDDAADVPDTPDGVELPDSDDAADAPDVPDVPDAADDAGFDPDVWVPPAPGPEDFQMEFDNLTLKTGEEVIMCWYLPPTGKERWVHAVEMEFEYGIHHVRVDRIEDQIGKPAYGPIDCLENTGHAPNEPGWFTTGELPGAQDNHMHMKFPEGTGFRLAPNHGLYFEVHALNTTLKPKDIKGSYKVYTVPKGKISSAVGLLLAFNQKLNYPPKQVSTETASCTFKQPYEMIFATGHMHAYGTLLEAKLNGTTIYQTTDVEDVAINSFLPPLQILPGDTLTWSCTYDNKLDTPLLIGFSDIYAAMCGFVGFIHPTVDSKSVICDGL